MPTEETLSRVVHAFDDAFSTTMLEVREPKGPTFKTARVGYHDDSFTYSTLDGEHGGGTEVEWYFYRRMVSLGTEVAWKHSMIGGEIRPENQHSVFEPDFPAPGPTAQNITTCIELTHASYMLCHAAFQSPGYTGASLANANVAAERMGYQFEVSRVFADHSGGCLVDLDFGENISCVTLIVTIVNHGVAPFYYPLVPELAPADQQCKISPVEAVELRLLQPGRAVNASFIITGLAHCFNSVMIQLVSNHTYPDRPVRFAHRSSPAGVQLTVPRIQVTAQNGAGPSGPFSTSLAYMSTTVQAITSSAPTFSTASDANGAGRHSCVLWCVLVTLFTLGFQ